VLGLPANRTQESHHPNTRRCGVKGEDGMKKTIYALAAAHLLMVIFTFGRAYAHTPQPANPFVQREVDATFRGLFAGLFWPLYWSTVAWEKS